MAQLAAGSGLAIKIRLEVGGLFEGSCGVAAFGAVVGEIIHAIFLSHVLHFPFLDFALPSFLSNQSAWHNSKYIKQLKIKLGCLI